MFRFQAAGGSTRAAVVWTLLAVLPTAGLAAQQHRPLDGLASSIQRNLRDWNVAGLAVAIVKDDSVVFARGFGVREVGRSEPVDENTVFAIGSMTKLFTAVAAGTMVDAGKMQWDDPVVRYLPEFAVGDPYVTQHLTLRDALTHRTGLDWRLDFLWLDAPLGPTDIVARLRSFAPEPGFRAAYGYSNVMFLVAGQAIGKAAGSPWDDVIRARIFEPLGMRSSTTDIRNVPSGRVVAKPHVNWGGPLRPITAMSLQNTAPAGSIWSTVTDMARWLRMLQRKGELDGKRVIEAKTLAEVLEPVTVVGEPDPRLKPRSHFLLYGMGVELLDYRGRKVVKHGGRVDGMVSEFAIVPEVGLSVVALSNTSGPVAYPPDLPEAVVFTVIDRYLGAPTKDWTAEFLAARKATAARRVEAAKREDSGRPPAGKPSLPMSAYVGRYAGPVGSAPRTPEDDALLRRVGPWAVVEGAGDSLSIRIGPIQSQLEHWKDDTFRLFWGPLGSLFGRFEVSADRRVTTLSIPLVGDFERVDDR